LRQRAGSAVAKQLTRGEAQNNSLRQLTTYRLKLNTADALELFKRTVWFEPRTTTCMMPDMAYSLL
jgi:hypothetical protein